MCWRVSSLSLQSVLYVDSQPLRGAHDAETHGTVPGEVCVCVCVVD